MKRRTSTNNSEPTLANNDIFLPSNQLTEQEVNGDSIVNEEPILYTKSILHTQPNSRARDMLHTSSFSVARTMDSRID